MIYYVSPTGKDTNPGTQALPFLTIQQGASILKPGDNLNVESGSYAGFICGWDPNGLYGPIAGTAAAPITIQADPEAVGGAGSVIINAGNHYTPEGIDFEPAHALCDHIIIKGFTLDGSKIPWDWPPADGAGTTQYGIRISQSTGVQVLGNTVRNFAGFGIFTSHTTDCVIDSNTVTAIQGSGESGHGIYVSNSAVRPVITNNASFANAGEGIHANGDISQGAPGLISNATITGNVVHGNGENGLNFDGIQNSKITGNLVYGNARHQLAIYKEDAGGASSNNLITDNTFDGLGSSGAGVQLINGATGNVIQNNIIFGGANGDVVVDPASRVGLVSDYNITGGKYGDYTGAEVTLAAWQKATKQDAHSLQSTPVVFTAAGATPPDFSLAPKSPAIGAGTPAGTNIGYAAAGVTAPAAPPPPPPPVPFVLGRYTFPNGEPTLAQYKEMVRKASYGDVSGLSGLPDGMVDIQDLNVVVAHWQLTVPAA